VVASSGRSLKTRIENGEGDVELEFTIAPDPLMNPDKSWSEEGTRQLRGMLKHYREEAAETEQTIDQLWLAFQNTPRAVDLVKRWKFDHAVWIRALDQSLVSIDKPPEAKAKAGGAARGGKHQ
jgi:hypothetical protein